MQTNRGATLSRTPTLCVFTEGVTWSDTLNTMFFSDFSIVL